MPTVGDLKAWLDGVAPPGLAEDWDNVGLLLGDPARPVGRVMTCLTVTAATAAEAVRRRADLIVSHHPILFRGAKRLVATDPTDGFVWSLAAAGVSVLSPHTAYDNAEGGINDGLARRLGMTEVGPLRPTPGGPAFKVTAFTPETDRDAVLAAAFAAGAGRIGNYAECSFSTPGIGTFFGEAGSNPTVGEAGRRESAPEDRVEILCPAGRLHAVLVAIRAAHSYEEPAIDVYPLHVPAGPPGAGRLGRLAGPTTLGAFAGSVARVLGAPGTTFVGAPVRTVERVAIVCGAGDDFLIDATRAGADVMLTGEARFHRGLQAEALGIGLVVAGHHATERPGVEDLAARVAAAFPALESWPAEVERDPFRPASDG